MMVESNWCYYYHLSTFSHLPPSIEQKNFHNFNVKCLMLSSLSPVCPAEVDRQVREDFGC